MNAILSFSSWSLKYQLYVYLFVWVMTTHASVSRKEHELQGYLMSNYNVNILPKNEIYPIVVDIRMVVEIIVTIDEANELITTKFFFELRWKDEYLQWDPRDYGNVSETMFRQKQIWFPDIIVVNSINEYELLGFDGLKLIVNNTGDVMWAPGVTKTTVCQINTRLFPFDEQTCYIEIYEWTSGISRVLFNHSSPEANEFTYENAQWELVSTSSELYSNGYTFIRYGLHLKRRSLYYVTTVIFPVTFICILNCFTFLIPKQAGERIGYSITVFLAFVLILTIINDILPKTSKELSVFVVYLGTLMIIALLTIISSIVCLALGDVENDTKHTTNKEQEDHSQHHEMNKNGTACDKMNVVTESEEEQSVNTVKHRSTATNRCRHLGQMTTGFIRMYFESAAFFLVFTATVTSTVATYTILLASK